MPATTEKQKRFFGAELGRKKAGQKTETGMSEQQLTDFATKPVAPTRAHSDDHKYTRKAKY